MFEVFVVLAFSQEIADFVKSGDGSATVIQKEGCMLPTFLHMCRTNNSSMHCSFQ